MCWGFESWQYEFLYYNILSWREAQQQVLKQRDSMRFDCLGRIGVPVWHIVHHIVRELSQVLPTISWQSVRCNLRDLRRRSYC